MSNIALPHEKIGIVATIDPDAYTAATYVSDWVDMQDWPGGIMAVVMAGDLGSSATLDARLRQATDSSGTGAKDISGKVMTQFTQASTDSDKQAVITLLADQMDVAGGFRFAALSMVVAVAASDCGAIILGMNPSYGPATDVDLASVDEVVF